MSYHGNIFNECSQPIAALCTIAVLYDTLYTVDPFQTLVTVVKHGVLKRLHLTPLLHLVSCNKKVTNDHKYHSGMTSISIIACFSLPLLQLIVLL